MRLVFLSKRYPQQRDLLTRPYGRFHYLPAHLAKAGHDVKVFLISHRGLESVRHQSGGIDYVCLDLRRLGPMQVIRTIVSEVVRFRPDWVVGFSDTYLGWLAGRIARRTRARLAIDAYDNYESYMPWNFPLHYLWRASIRDANLVTAAGPQLAQLMQRSRQGKNPVSIVPMAADPAFFPRNVDESRAQLGLPLGTPLLGYFGGWGQSRGTDVLIDAFSAVRSAIPDARLVLSGRPPKQITAMLGVLPVGYLQDIDIPVLTNAVDVAYVICADTTFGRFSYPSKLCEALACGTPVVASATQAIRWMLADDASRLVPLGDPAQLALRTQEALVAGRSTYSAPQGWSEVAQTFEELLIARLHDEIPR